MEEIYINLQIKYRMKMQYGMSLNSKVDILE